MRVWPYEYRDAVTGSTRLVIEPDGESRAAVSVKGGSFVTVADPAPVVAAIYAAMGRPEPVILERPGSADAASPVQCSGILVGRLDGKVTVGLCGIQPEEMPPSAARELAALIAIRADEAQSEPDPAEVEKLTGFLVRHGAGLRTTGVDEIARAALN
jgi:hypothetical protein